MKVLFATDGSRYALEAARFLARRLCSRSEVEIDVLAVFQSDEGAPSTSEKPPPAGEAQEVRPTTARAEAQRWVTDARGALEGPGRKVGAKVLGGPPEEVVVGESQGYDLVVLGVKGRGASPFFELGRVARATLQRSLASVLLVRPPSEEGGEKAEDRFRVLLSAEEEDPGLHASWDMLHPFSSSDTEVEIVTVMPEASHGMALAARTTPGREPRHRVRERANRWLNRTLTSLPASGRPVRPLLLEGRPASELGYRAVESGADLLVMGGGRARTRDPRPSSPLGATARELAWSSPCSVLLVRGRELRPPVERPLSRRTGARTTQEV
ncbi:MAG: universal stress protein [Gemmatimonadota bacterium]